MAPSLPHPVPVPLRPLPAGRLALGLLAAMLLAFPAAPARAANPFGEEAIRPEAAAAPATPATPAPKQTRSLFGISLPGPLDDLIDRGAGLLGNAADKARGMKDKARQGITVAGDFLDAVHNIPGWIKQGKLSGKTRDELLGLARAHPERAWPLAGGDLRNSRNAHRTNTVEEMREALKGDYNWLECDVRLEGPLRDKIDLPGERRPIAAHDKFQTNGMLLEDWLQIGLASGRGLKIEIKDNAALDAVLALCKKHKVPAGRLILNIGIPDAGATPAAELVKKPVSDDRLTRIRAACPGCIINLSPSGANPDAKGHYGAAQIAQMIRYAKAAGQPVQFPLRRDLVGPETVKALRPYGKVAIWNDMGHDLYPDAASLAKDAALLRDWGIDGTIDLRQTS